MSKASVAARNMASLRYGSESVITRLPRAARGRSQRRHGAAGRADRAWGRMESGVATVVREPIDLVAIVHDVVEDAAFEAKSRGRAVEITETCDARVSGDPELLHSAVENVVRNAVRHTREGTAVEVSMGRAGAARVWIRVRDHGGGVPAEALPNIFQPFYRVGDARERGTGGVGPGLTIVHRTIPLHDGTARAVNVTGGGGLVVELTLPALPA